jgi:hypothetical protein
MFQRLGKTVSMTKEINREIKCENLMYVPNKPQWYAYIATNNNDNNNSKGNNVTQISLPLSGSFFKFLPGLGEQKQLKQEKTTVRRIFR